MSHASTDPRHQAAQLFFCDHISWNTLSSQCLGFKLQLYVLSIQGSLQMRQIKKLDMKYWNYSEMTTHSGEIM
jgi:hypothetical protein